MPRTGEDVVPSVVFSPDGNLVATAADEAAVWDARSGRRLLLLVGGSVGTTDAAFSPDGTRLAVTGADWTLRLYSCGVCGSVNRLLKRADVQLSHGA